MNKKLIRNIEKQKNLRKKKEEIEIELQLLAEEQEEIENLEVIKEFRSRKISLDEFLFLLVPLLITEVLFQFLLFSFLNSSVFLCF